MSVFISVVSHGHGELIKQLSCLATLAKKFTVVVKLNLEERTLIPYLEQNRIQYIDEQYGIGFGHNNNVVYSYCKKTLDMNEHDFFIVFNPDLISDLQQIDKLVHYMSKNEVKMASVNLFKDEKFILPDNSIRNFPTLSQFIKSFVGLGNSAIIDKGTVTNPIQVDWAAGSFLAFKASHYSLLKGFDEGYFMYCEDIDICYRSSLLGERIIFHPEIKMQHLAEHANRSILSKHFYWHVSSVIRFLMTKVNLTNSKSSID